MTVSNVLRAYPESFQISRIQTDASGNATWVFAKPFPDGCTILAVGIIENIGSNPSFLNPVSATRFQAVFKGWASSTVTLLGINLFSPAPAANVFANVIALAIPPNT